jgi:hypothetical protein
MKVLPYINKKPPTKDDKTKLNKSKTNTSYDMYQEKIGPKKQSVFPNKVDKK